MISTRPRLAFVASEVFPLPSAILGGPQANYLENVPPLLSDRFDVTVVSARLDNLPEVEIRDGVRYVRLAGFEDTPAYFANVRDYLATRAWDLVELFNRPTYAEPLRVVAPTARFVLGLHTDILHPGAALSGRRLVTESHLSDVEPGDPAVAAKALEHFSAIIAVSDHIGRRVKDLFPEQAAKVVTVRSGVDTTVFRPRDSYAPQELAALRPVLPDTGPGPVVLAAGRLIEDKGAHVLVRAIALLRQQYPDVHLIWIGSRWYGRNDDTPYQRDLEALAEPLGRSVRLTGFVPHFLMPYYLLLGDVFVCPSQWHEPLARVLYEAMAAGLPLITTDRGGNGEVVDDGRNGLVVRPHDDPEAFARVLHEVLADPRRRAMMGTRARELAVAFYGWNRVAKQLAGVLAKTLRRSSS